MATQFRRVEKQVGESFVPANFNDLVSGDGEDPIEKGDVVFLATGDPLPYGVEGNYIIQARPA
jgi:precorrin-6B methylase 1